MPERLSKHSSGGSKLSSTHILTVLGAGTALSLLGDSTLYTVLPDPENAAIAGVTLAAVGILLGANRFTRMLTNPFAGALYDRLPRRGMLILSMFLGTICTVIYALGSGFPIILTGRVLWGLAWSGIWIGGNTVILDISRSENRGKLSGIYQTWFFIGVGASALLAGVFTDLFGFRGGLLMSAGLNALALLLWIFLLPETRSEIPISAGNAPVASTGFNWPTIIYAALPTFGIRFVYAGAIASTSILWLASLLEPESIFSDFNLPIATSTGIFVALRTIMSMVGAPISGTLSDRIGRRWGVIAVLLFIGSSGTWLMGSRTVSLALFGGFVAAIPGGGVQALIPALIGDRISNRQESRALGLVYTFGDLGSALGPIIALGLVGTLGIATIYRLCAILLGSLALFSLFRSFTEVSRHHSSGA